MMVLQAKVTTKGQITLPKAIRESLAIESGDRLEFSMDGANTASVRKMQPHGSSAGCAREYLKHGHKPLSVAATKSAIREAMRLKYAQPSK
jgi:antitoxin PrlF